jgi:hypothetical protein
MKIIINEFEKSRTEFEIKPLYDFLPVHINVAASTNDVKVMGMTILPNEVMIILNKLPADGFYQSKLYDGIWIGKPCDGIDVVPLIPEKTEAIK